jgi:hypothetical protein
MATAAKPPAGHRQLLKNHPGQRSVWCRHDASLFLADARSGDAGAGRRTAVRLVSTADRQRQCLDRQRRA